MFGAAAQPALGGFGAAAQPAAGGRAAPMNYPHPLSTQRYALCAVSLKPIELFHLVPQSSVV